MAFVKRLVTRTSQPQGLVGIDWSNPLTRGLAGTYSAPLKNDAVKNAAVALTGAVTPTASTGGVLLGGFAGNSSNRASIAHPLVSGAFTVSFTVLRKASTANQAYIAQGGGGPGKGWSIGSQANTSGLNIVFGGVAVYTLCATGLDADGVRANRVTVRVTGNGGTASAWIDGVLAGSVSVGTMQTPASTRTLIGCDHNNATYNNPATTGVLIGDVAIHTRALSDAEIKSLSANPWQIFEPEVTRLWIDDTVSAGGAATVIPIGVQATGSVGTPSATGAARATPAGVSASSAVGTPVAVGGASIPATVLPAGVQATSAIGAVSATGAAVAQPVGVVASSAVGTPVAIAGTSIPATVLPAGVQASSAVGTPAAQGAAIAQPLGVAATAYVGTPTIATGVSGVAVAYPAGVQAIGQVGTLIATGAAWTAAVGVQAVASVGTPAAYAGEIVIYVAGAQTRPSRLQSSSRPSRLQTGARASR